MESIANPSLLIVDDDVSFVRAAAELARAIPYDITVAGTLRQAELWLRRERFDLALIDLMLPDGSGLDLISSCARRATDVVLVTGHPTIESAVLACRTSLLDYLIKPIEPARYRELLERTVQRRRLPPPTSSGGWHGIVGTSAALSRLITQVQRVGPTGASVLIQGENGVGKELVARAVHAESGRTGPFVALDCGAVPAELLGAHLFGDADGAQPGYLAQARGGTVFFDEIAELPADLQVRLLRSLDAQSGDPRSEVRIIAATTFQGGRGTSDTRLREDLFYRLAEFPIVIAPLRERPDDIVALANLFLARLNERYAARKAFNGEALEQLRRFSWPGNVLELRNVVGRAYIMSGSDVIHDPLGQVRITEPLQETRSTLTVAVGSTFEEVERRMLLKTLEFFGNDKTKAARALGVSVKTIYNHLARQQNPAETG